MSANPTSAATPAWHDAVEITAFRKAGARSLSGSAWRQMARSTATDPRASCPPAVRNARGSITRRLRGSHRHDGAARGDCARRVARWSSGRCDATKRALNGTEFRPDLIARTAEHIVHRPDRPAPVLVDVDVKGMPRMVRHRIDEIGGYWPALVSVLPELAKAGRVERASTSAGLFRTDTGEALPGSDGLHIYIVLEDGDDVERFLRRLHERCWLHGFGWLMVGAAGHLLDRSIVDRMVYAAERLVFEGAPILDAPLAQDQAIRAPHVTPGLALDSHACEDLNGAERAKLRAFRAAEAHRQGAMSRRRAAITSSSSPSGAVAHSRSRATRSERLLRASCCPTPFCRSTQTISMARQSATCWPSLIASSVRRSPILWRARITVVARRSCAGQTAACGSTALRTAARRMS